MTTQQQIEQEAREFAEGWRDHNGIMQAYIAGATRYAPKWRPIEEYDVPPYYEVLFYCSPGVYYGWMHDNGTFYEGTHQISPKYFIPLPELPNPCT